MNREHTAKSCVPYASINIRRAASVSPARTAWRIRPSAALRSSSPTPIVPLAPCAGGRASARGEEESDGVRNLPGGVWCGRGRGCPGGFGTSVRPGGRTAPVEALEEAPLVAVPGARQPLGLDPVRQPGAERAQGAEGLHQEPLGLVRLSERRQEALADAKEAWKLHAGHLNHTAWPVDSGSDSWGSG